jgi:hypothetical protein
MISGSSAHINIHGTTISHNNGSEGGGLYVFTVSCQQCYGFAAAMLCCGCLLLLLCICQP